MNATKPINALTLDIHTDFSHFGHPFRISPFAVAPAFPTPVIIHVNASRLNTLPHRYVRIFPSIRCCETANNIIYTVWHRVISRISRQHNINKKPEYRTCTHRDSVGFRVFRHTFYRSFFLWVWLEPFSHEITESFPARSLSTDAMPVSAAKMLVHFVCSWHTGD